MKVMGGGEGALKTVALGADSAAADAMGQCRPPSAPLVCLEEQWDLEGRDGHVYSGRWLTYGFNYRIWSLSLEFLWAGHTSQSHSVASDSVF